MRRRRSRVGPWQAALLFVGCAGFAAWSLVGHFDGLPGGAAAPAPAAVEPEPDFDPSAEVVAGDQGSQTSDLLARHGSYARRAGVRFAFARPAEAAVVSPAPAGETTSRPAAWRGADPPELKLGVIMVGATARRAVLGGRVVGVGDEVGGVTVTGIERDRVVTTWGRRALTYDLLDGWPREFRPERDRRARAAGGPEPDAEPSGGAGARAGDQNRRGQQ